MIICKDSLTKAIPPHEWFAWYPIWAWDGELLHGVWMETVMREHKENSILRWRYTRIKI